MYTPGLACRVSTREALRSLRGRLTDDIRLPKNHENGKRRRYRDAPCGALGHMRAGSRRRPAHPLSPLRGSPAGPHRSRAARSRPPRTQPDGSLLVSDRCNPSEVPGSLRCHFSARERQGPSYLSSCGRLRETSATVLRHIPPPTTDSAGRAPSRSRRQSGFQRSPSKHPAGRSAAVHSAVRQRQPTMIEILSGSIA
jgi:hypothetical protein